MNRPWYCPFPPPLCYPAVFFPFPPLPVARRVPSHGPRVLLDCCALVHACVCRTCGRSVCASLSSEHQKKKNSMNTSRRGPDVAATRQRKGCLPPLSPLSVKLHCFALSCLFSSFVLFFPCCACGLSSHWLVGKRPFDYVQRERVARRSHERG